MGKAIALIALALTLSGCEEKVRVVTKEVFIPTPVPCPTPIVRVELPPLSVETLTETSTPEEIAKAYVESLGVLKRELRTAKEALDAYATPTPAPAHSAAPAAATAVKPGVSDCLELADPPATG